ncbi:MAG: Spy/CpxP family protein refolding chaperone [Candidatus Cloacimonetes bacterium]|jgi:Spy/CpxP family protein refolding chaperone|nr:Spy/CpxP family protein refolding chaperone [Candidatus Cloacimonadota bacterium]
MKKLVFVVIGVIAVIGLLTAFDGDGRGFKDCDQHQMKGRMNKDGDHPKMMQGMHDGYQMMCEELDLTDEQKEQMEDLRIKGKKSMIAAGAELELLGIDKRDVMKDKDFKQAKAITKEMFKLKQQIAINRIEHHEQRWNILTPEQKEKAEELMGEHHSPNLNKMKRK